MSVTLPTSSLPADFNDLHNAAGCVINIDNSVNNPTGPDCPDLGGVRLGVNLANSPLDVEANDITY